MNISTWIIGQANHILTLVPENKANRNYSSFLFYIIIYDVEYYAPGEYRDIIFHFVTKYILLTSVKTTSIENIHQLIE